MLDEAFARGTTFVHRLDPRVRLAMAVLFSVCVALVHQPVAAAAGLVAAALLLIFSRPGLKTLCKRVAMVNVFVFFLWATVPWTMPGEPLFSLGPIGFSHAGVALVWLVTLKSNALLFCFLALVATMDSPTMGYALDRLGMPSKLVFLFLFTYRYLHVIVDEWQRLRAAARLRGFVPRSDLHTYRTIGYLFAMVLVNSFDRSGRVYKAMILRGFDGRFRSVVRFRAGCGDGVFVAGCLTIVLGLVLLDCGEVWFV